MLEEKIYKDYLEALKSKDKHKREFLSFIRAELKNAAIELRIKELDDSEVLKVLKKVRRRLGETKESIASSGRKEYIESLDRELAILDGYLPKPLSEPELLEIIDQVISELGASSLKDMGRVMKEVLAKVGVRVEAKKVSEIVKSKLSSNQR
jgi:hypothetical protein